MKDTGMKQRIYATLLGLGAAFMFARTIILLSEGVLSIYVAWVSVMLFIEMLLDLGCLVFCIRWWISNDRSKAGPALRLGAAVALFHALRVLVFVLGRTGPWFNLDIRPEHIEMHYARWTWADVYFAGIMSILGVIGVIIIWLLIRRSRIKQDR
jgi:hypothetical protein